MNTTLSPNSNHPTLISMATHNLLPACLLIFLGILIAVDNSKLVNNFFYLTLMLPALFMMFRRVLRPRPTALLLGSYLVYVALSTFWGTGDFMSGLKQLKYVVYVLAFLVVTHQAASSPNRIQLIACCGLVLSLILEAHSLFTQISSIGFHSWLTHFPRLSQPTGPLNPIFLALTVGLFGFILIASRIRNPWLASALVGIIILVTLPLQSRSLILSIVVAHSYLLFRMKAYHVLATWCVLCIATGMALMMSIDRFSAVHRIDIWLYTINVWFHDCSLLLGCGNRYDFNIDINNTHFYHPHSIWLSQLLYGGLAGVILLAATAWLLRREFNSTATYWPPVFLFCVTAFLTDGHTLLTHPDFIWLLTWLPLALSGILFSPAETIKHAKQHHEADANSAVPV